MKPTLRRAASAIAASAAWLTASAGVLACPICFRVEGGPVVDGVRAAVLVLMGVTVAVLAGFGAFIVRFVRRAGEAEGEA